MQLHQKRNELAEEKEAHELTMAEKESLLSALEDKEKPQAGDTSEEELVRLRFELQTSLRSEQRLQKELDAAQQSNRQDTLQVSC